MATIVKRLVLIAVCALQLGCGNQPPTAPTPPTTPSGAQPLTVVLSGRLVESTTSDPVAAANVAVRRPGGSLQFHGASDANGAFRISDLSPGDITLVIAKTGYEFTERDLTLTADTSLTFPIVPRRFALSGRVIDVNTGSALSGATITVLDGDNASRTAVADSEGAYRLPDLWYGGFTVRVRQNGYDSVFRGIRLVEDTAFDVVMQRAEQSLAGTWTGTVTRGGIDPIGGYPLSEVTLTHSGATVAASRVGEGSFSGTLREPPRIGSTTELTGVLIWNTTTGPPRGFMNCRGIGDFTGTVNWTQLRITAPRVVFDCPQVAPHSVSISLLRQQ